MGNVAEERFKEAIRNTYGCEAFFVEAVPTSDTFQGKIVWEGILVHVFGLIDCPEAERAYVWSELQDGVTGRQTIKVVLHAGPVASPVDAVRASIVKEHRDEGRGKP